LQEAHLIIRSFIFNTLGKTLVSVKRLSKKKIKKAQQKSNVIIKHCLLLLRWLRKAV